MPDSNIKAQYAYIAAHAEAARLIRQLKKQLNDFAAPGEQTNWGHVGDINAMVSKLRHALIDWEDNES